MAADIEMLTESLIAETETPGDGLPANNEMP